MAQKLGMADKGTAVSAQAPEMPNGGQTRMEKASGISGPDESVPAVDVEAQLRALEDKHVHEVCPPFRSICAPSDCYGHLSVACHACVASDSNDVVLTLAGIRCHRSAFQQHESCRLAQGEAGGMIGYVLYRDHATCPRADVFPCVLAAMAMNAPSPGQVREFIESLPPGALLADAGYSSPGGECIYAAVRDGSSALLPTAPALHRLPHNLAHPARAEPDSSPAWLRCGNGKYFGVRQDIAVIASDRSKGRPPLFGMLRVHLVLAGAGIGGRRRWAGALLLPSFQYLTG